MNRVQTQTEELCRKRLTLFEEIQDLTSRHLRFKPGPDKWSILMVIEHLVLAKREIIGNVVGAHKKISRKRCLRDRIAYLIVLFVLKVRFPVPVVSDAMKPSGRVSLEVLLRQWEKTHEQLLTFLETVKQETFGSAIFRHPFAGPLNVAQVVRLARLHFDSHARQIRRNLRLMGYKQKQTSSFRC